MGMMPMMIFLAFVDRLHGFESAISGFLGMLRHSPCLHGRHVGLYL